MGDQCNCDNSNKNITKPKDSDINFNVKKEAVLNNVIGLNPTGTLTFDGTYKLNGSNNIILNPSESSKKNLEKSQNNSIRCDSLEKFENNSIEKNTNIILNANYNKIIYLLIILFLIILLIYFLYKKYLNI